MYQPETNATTSQDIQTRFGFGQIFQRGRKPRPQRLNYTWFSGDWGWAEGGFGGWGRGGGDIKKQRWQDLIRSGNGIYYIEWHCYKPPTYGKALDRHSLECEIGWKGKSCMLNSITKNAGL